MKLGIQVHFDQVFIQVFRFILTSIERICSVFDAPVPSVAAAAGFCYCCSKYRT